MSSGIIGDGDLASSCGSSGVAADAPLPASIGSSTTFESAFAQVDKLRMRDVRRAFQIVTTAPNPEPDDLFVEKGMTFGEFAVAHMLSRNGQ